MSVARARDQRLASAPTLPTRRWLVGVSASLALGAAIGLLGGWSFASTSAPVAPMQVGAVIVSADTSTIVLTVIGPAGPGKLSGTTLTTRVTPETEFIGLTRDQQLRPSTEVVATIDANPHSDGSYALLSLYIRVR